MHSSKITKSKIHIQTNFMHFNMHSSEKNKSQAFIKCIIYKEQTKKNSCNVMHPTYMLQQKKSNFMQINRRYY